MVGYCYTVRYKTIRLEYYSYSFLDTVYRYTAYLSPTFKKTIFNYIKKNIHQQALIKSILKCHHLLPIPFFSSWSNAIVLYALIGSFLLAGKIRYYWLICTRKKYLINAQRLRIRLQIWWITKWWWSNVKRYLVSIFNIILFSKLNSTNWLYFVRQSKEEEVTNFIDCS